jgi:hypothetical protein
VDAKRLARRWEAGQFDASIDRGIKHEKLSLGQGKTRWAHSLKMEEGDHRDAHIQGHNGLDIGQWWFSRLAVLRDGAHGEIEAGIFGAAKALAIALSGKGYANVDNGDVSQPIPLAKTQVKNLTHFRKSTTLEPQAKRASPAEEPNFWSPVFAIGTQFVCYDPTTKILNTRQRQGFGMMACTISCRRSLLIQNGS